MQNTRDTIAAREAWKKGDRQTWEAILARNPNVGLEVRGGGYRFNLYGADAGDFLGRLSTALTAGLLVAGDAATRAAHGGIYSQEAKTKNNDTAEYKDALDSKQKEVLNDAAAIAKAALENSDCAKFLAGNSNYNPTNILEGFLRDGRFFHGGTPGSVATTYGGYGSPSLAYISAQDKNLV